MHRRSALAVGLTALTALLTGCTSGSPGAGAQDPAATLAQAKAHLDSAGSVAFTLTSSDVPTTGDGVIAAKGVGVIDPTTPKFEGEFTGKLGGVSGTIGLKAVGSQTYVKFFDESYKPFNLESLGAPNPARLFSPQDGLASLLTKTSNAAFGARFREGPDVLREVKGTLPGDEILRLFSLGDGKADFAVTYGITESGELRTTRATGPFYEGATSTYTIVVKDYGKPVDVTLP